MMVGLQITSIFKAPIQQLNPTTNPSKARVCELLGVASPAPAGLGSKRLSVGSLHRRWNLAQGGQRGNLVKHSLKHVWPVPVECWEVGKGQVTRLRNTPPAH